MFQVSYFIQSPQELTIHLVISSLRKHNKLHTQEAAPISSNRSRNLMAMALYSLASAKIKFSSSFSCSSGLQRRIRAALHPQMKLSPSCDVTSLGLLALQDLIQLLLHGARSSSILLILGLQVDGNVSVPLLR